MGPVADLTQPVRWPLLCVVRAVPAALFDAPPLGMHSKTNTLAIVSLVAGIVGWTAMPLVGSIVAIVTGHMARGQIRQSYGLETGDGLAVGGLVLGYLSVVLGIVGIIFAVLVIVGVIGLGFLSALFGGT